MNNLSITTTQLSLDDIENIAVISMPRTGSKSLVNTIAIAKNKFIAYGVLHKPKYLGKIYSENEIRNIVFSKQYTLHGHWHTLHLLPYDVQDFVKKHFKIVTILRDHKMIKKSVNILLNQTMGLNICMNTIEQQVDQIINDSCNIMSQWPIHKVYTFRQLYNKI